MILFSTIAMKECEYGQRGCWSDGADQPWFSMAEVSCMNMLWSWLKFLAAAVSYISSAPQQGAHLFESDQIRRRAQQMTWFIDVECVQEFAHPFNARSHILDVTLSTALKFSSKFFRKRSFFDQNQQPLINVEPFERILRALFIAQCPYKFSSFLDLRNGSSRFRLFARDFRLFRFFFTGSACFC